MAAKILTLTKHAGNKAVYTAEGFKTAVRIPTNLFPLGVPPQTLPLGDDTVTFAEPATAASGRASMPPEVAEAAAKLKAFRDAQKAEKESRMTADQKAKRDARNAEREAAKTARRAKTTKKRK